MMFSIALWGPFNHNLQEELIVWWSIGIQMQGCSVHGTMCATSIANREGGEGQYDARAILDHTFSFTCNEIKHTYRGERSGVW